MVAVDDRWVVLTEEHGVVDLFTWGRQKAALRISEDTASEENKGLNGSKETNKTRN